MLGFRYGLGRTVCGSGLGIQVQEGHFGPIGVKLLLQSNTLETAAKLSLLVLALS